jgi:cytidylate kinase
MKIAIDGPAGAGKTTVGKALAKRFGLRFVNTGVMYRAVAWAFAQGLHLDEIILDFDENGRVLIDGHPVEESTLYTVELDRLASEVARRPEVRRRLIALQKRIAARGNVVMEGRDIGTVVMPDADIKLYIDASPEERARRRVRERPGISEAEMLREIRERDERDRGFGRLLPTPDSIVLRTDGKSPEETIAEAISQIENSRRFARPSGPC